jgi:hypothetical protein
VLSPLLFGGASNAGQGGAQALSIGEALQSPIVAAGQQRRDRGVRLRFGVSEPRPVSEIENRLFWCGDQTRAEVGRHQFGVQRVRVALDEVDHAVPVSQDDVTTIVRDSHDRDAQSAWDNVVHSSRGEAQQYGPTRSHGCGVRSVWATNCRLASAGPRHRDGAFDSYINAVSRYRNVFSRKTEAYSERLKYSPE